MVEHRQFVSFTFYKVISEWRRLPPTIQEAARREFLRVFQGFQEKLLTTTYSLIGLRGDVDWMTWRVAENLEVFQEMSAQLAQTTLGSYLATPYSYLSMTRRSIYVKEHTHTGSESSRLTVEPPRAKYLFVYPFWKTSEWYLLPMEERQKMMDEHIAIGHTFPAVKIHTTYSFGLDDPEFVLAFESDSPSDFLDLVMRLRESKTRVYTLRDTPIFTCVKQSVEATVKAL